MSRLSVKSDEVNSLGFFFFHSSGVAHSLASHSKIHTSTEQRLNSISAFRTKPRDEYTWASSMSSMITNWTLTQSKKVEKTFFCFWKPYHLLFSWLPSRLKKKYIYFLHAITDKTFQSCSTWTLTPHMRANLQKQNFPTKQVECHGRSVPFVDRTTRYQDGILVTLQWGAGLPHLALSWCR